MRLSKARTLRLLRESQAPAFTVDPFVTFTVKQWHESPTQCLDLVRNAGLGELLAVRSAAMTEDADADIPPGLFHSELNVSALEPGALLTAVERVVESFERDDHARSSAALNEVIVQRQLTSATMCGIISTGAPHDLYLSVDYDDESGRTDSVTAGRACKHVDVLRDATSLSEPWYTLHQAVLAVERLFDLPLLIEFGISAQGQVHIFQARHNRQATPLPVQAEDRALSVGLIKEATSQISRVGHRSTIWSDMADWNPAEMLGNKARPLAVSLYEYLVTNEAWILGRASLGYRYVTPSELIETIAGKPYVNVRRSFLSLTPASLPTQLAERLVEDRLTVLAEHPQLHDKVELELLFTAADPASPARTQCLLQRGFSETEVDELSDHLCALTRFALGKYYSYYRSDTALVKQLAEWSVRNRPSTHEQDMVGLLWFIRRGLAKCRDEGVVPFARQARLAFIARDLLNRLKFMDCFDADWLDSWMRSLDTVAARVAQALAKLGQGQMTKAAFDAVFGHLRGRTYDICSPRYDQIQHMPDAGGPPAARYQVEPLRIHHKARLEKQLEQAGLQMSAGEFFDFAGRVLKAREETKFAFSTVLSDVLEAIATLGLILEYSRDHLSFLSVEDLIASEDIGAADLRSRFGDLIARQRSLWAAAQHLILPDLITSPVDLSVVKQHLTRPNFVTTARVTGDVVVLATLSPNGGAGLGGKIVALEAAEPGSDWILALGIAGLVTRYGGALSHMTIRCAEFGIPAAIGCGNEIFFRVARAKRISLDCMEGRIDIIEDETDA